MRNCFLYPFFLLSPQSRENHLRILICALRCFFFRIFVFQSRFPFEFRWSTPTSKPTSPFNVDHINPSPITYSTPQRHLDASPFVGTSPCGTSQVHLPLDLLSSRQHLRFQRTRKLNARKYDKKYVSIDRPSKTSSATQFHLMTRHHMRYWMHHSDPTLEEIDFSVSWTWLEARSNMQCTCPHFRRFNPRQSTQSTANALNPISIDDLTWNMHMRTIHFFLLALNRSQTLLFHPNATFSQKTTLSTFFITCAPKSFTHVAYSFFAIQCAIY